MGKNVNLPPAYVERVKRLKEKLGVSSESEIIRRAIDELAVKYKVL